MSVSRTVSNNSGTLKLGLQVVCSRWK